MAHTEKNSPAGPSERSTPDAQRSTPNTRSSSPFPPDPPRAAEIPLTETPLFYAWIVLLAIPLWLLFYWDSRSGMASPTVLWGLYGIIVAGEAIRTWLLKRDPYHPAHDFFTYFDSAAIGFAVYFTGGIHSELWLFYLFQLIAGALSPRPQTLKVLGLLVVVSYAAAILAGTSLQDWVGFFRHFRFPSMNGSSVSGTATGDGHEEISRLIVRFFFLLVIGRMAQALSQGRARQEREIAVLREQVVVGEDRNRIARELHDSLNQTLVGSVLRLEVCRRILRQSPEEAATMLDEEKTALRQSLDSVRDYVFHLRPAELADEPLADLLRHYGQRFAERTGVEVKVDVEEIPDPRPAIRVAAVRIVQEAMTNTVKHANASRIRVEACKEKKDSLRILVRDDGKGFDPEAVKDGGMGMACMRERAEAVGGKMAIESAPGQGTTVIVTLPLRGGFAMGAERRNTSS
ncbi:MAG: sensor histidine kinase [Armatimonadetes bacterium]|nr:sensor histidine kinase [Armatimonadota bacterium]